MDHISTLTATAADDLERRLVGADSDQAVFIGIAPSARINFGTLASQAAAQRRHHDGQRADFAPNAMAVRFTAPVGAALNVAISFAVYAGVRKGGRFNRAWAASGGHTWGVWAPPTSLDPPNENAPAGGAYVRLRYEQHIQLTAGDSQA